jgi:glutamate carboxypeptidase
MIRSDMQATLDWIATQQQHMVFLTDSWSRINSGSYHLEGIRKFRGALEDNFRWLEGDMEVIPLSSIPQINSQGIEIQVEMAEALSIRKRPEAPIQILLVGHMDTVYGSDHVFQEPKYLDENTLNGPGVADLKGGLVVMLKALESLEKFSGKDQLGWQVLLNPDEEIGSVASDPLLKQAAAGKQLGLIYEPAMEGGALAGERKGSGNFSITVHGRSAHAGRNPEQGRNAIVACAEITSLLFALNGKRQGVTLNPGKVEGGGALNAVPDLAIIRFNIRTRQSDDEAWVLGEIEKILDGFRDRDGFSVALYGHFTRAPKPMSPLNKAVFDMVLACGHELGLEIAIKPSGGCCDGNNLWRHGLPNVDTLGVRGGQIHSEQEFILLDSLVERAQLSALLLMKLAAGELAIADQPVKP